jgi:tight adherence protein B
MRLGHALRAAAGPLAAAGALVLLAVTPALAEPEGRIASLQSVGSTLEIVFTATDLPPDTSLDPASVQVSLDGTALPSAAEPINSRTTTVARTSMLTMDTSGSMKGERLDSAKAAANAYLDSVPGDVSVGLVAFADAASVVVQPTTDRREVRAAVAGLTAVGATALYDATKLSVESLGTAEVRSVVLLTDGQNEGGSTTLEQAVAAVEASGATVDAVAIGTDPALLAPLEAIAAAGNGTVITSTDTAQLTDAFNQAAATITNQLLVTVTPDESQGGLSGNIAVSAQAGPLVVADSAFATLPTVSDPGATGTEYGPQPVPEASGLQTRSGLLPWAIGLLFVGLAILLAIALTTAARARRSTVKSRLSVYSLAGRQPVKEAETSTSLGDSGVARSAVELAGRVVQKRDLEGVLGSKLEAAGLPLKAAEWLLIHVGIAIGLGLVLLLLFGGRLAPALIGLAIGLIAPWVYLSRKESKRTARFLEQMPDTLQLIAGSLSAGYSMPQAVDTVVREGQPPMSTELNRALVETRLGVPMEDALEGIAARMRSEDFAWVVMAIRIQREVGGNLAEVLTTVAATLRERERLRRQVRVLSAEGRLSAWILGLLPVVFAIYLIFVRPEYISLLVTEPLGWVMIIVGAILLLAGVLWLRKAIKVEV